VKVITLSKVFLTGHPRRGQLTGFRSAFEQGLKIHTVRKNAKGYYQDRDVVSVREWSAAPYNSAQVVIRNGVKIGVVPVRILYWSRPESLCIYVGGQQVPMPEFAFNDGLAPLDFLNWFFPKRKDEIFEGSLIYFSDFRYAQSLADSGEERVVKNGGSE